MLTRGDSVVGDFDINSSEDEGGRITWRSDSETQQNNNPPLSRLRSMFSRVTNHEKKSYNSLMHDQLTCDNQTLNRK